MKIRICSKKAGFTLVEMMVAILLGSLLVTAIYSLFIIQNQSYANQNNVADIQQNVRMAMNILSAEFRMAGFGFSMSGDYKTTSNTFDNVYAVTPVTPTTGDPNTDSVTLRYGINPTTLNAAMTTSNVNSMVVVNTGDLHLDLPNNDYYIIISDGQDASRLRVTGITNGTTLAITAVNPSCFPASGFAAGSLVYKLKQVTYRISNNVLQSQTNGGSWIDVVNNIEDLQLAYRGMIPPSGTWMDNPSPVNRKTIWAPIVPPATDVQLNILARSNAQDLQFTGQRPLIRDHAAGSSDHYRRRLLTSTIKIRNL